MAPFFVGGEEGFELARASSAAASKCVVVHVREAKVQGIPPLRR